MRADTDAIAKRMMHPVRSRDHDAIHLFRITDGLIQNISQGAFKVTPGGTDVWHGIHLLAVEFQIGPQCLDDHRLIGGKDSPFIMGNFNIAEA